MDEFLFVDWSKFNVFLQQQLKLKSAATIVKEGKPVTIVKCRSLSAEQALQGKAEIDVGTTISPLDSP